MILIRQDCKNSHVTITGNFLKRKNRGGKKGYAKIRYKEMFDEINKKEKKI